MTETAPIDTGTHKQAPEVDADAPDVSRSLDGRFKSRDVDEAVTQVKNRGAETFETVASTAEKVINAGKNGVRDALAGIEQAPNIAGQALNETAAIAENVYRGGATFLSPKVQAHPLLALAVAGAVGYSLGYLFGRR